MQERGYLQSGSFKVDHRLFPDCPKCNHTLIDQPHENKATIKSNEALKEEWKRNRKKLDNYLYHDGSPLLNKGKAVSKINNPKLKGVIIMCHCWHNKHASYFGGSACALQCKDPVSGKQYKAGQCPVCICSCAFVCTTM
jgi:hypothetical protein